MDWQGVVVAGIVAVIEVVASAVSQSGSARTDIVVLAIVVRPVFVFCFDLGC